MREPFPICSPLCYFDLPPHMIHHHKPKNEYPEDTAHLPAGMKVKKLGINKLKGILEQSINRLKQNNLIYNITKKIDYARKEITLVIKCRPQIILQYIIVVIYQQSKSIKSTIKTFNHTLTILRTIKELCK